MLMSRGISPIFQAIIPTVRRGWLYDNKIVLYQTEGHEPETVDAWANSVWQDINVWHSDRHFSALHDFRNSGFSVYARERAQEITFNLPPRLEGYVAVVIADTIVGRTLGKTAKFLMRRHQNTMKIQIFTDFDEALNWLESKFD